MAEITMKSTKAEIMEAYKAAVEKLDTRERMIDDPAKEAAKAKKVEVIESADKTAKEDIFNPEIIKKYNDLTEAIEIKQLELDLPRKAFYQPFVGRKHSILIFETESYVEWKEPIILKIIGSF